MKVLHLGKFYPPEPGGIETATQELAREQVRRGYQVEVLCASRSLRTQVDPPCSEEPGVVRAGSLASLNSVSISPVMIAEFTRRARKADICHVHMPDPMAALAVRWAEPRVPLILHWHSDVVRQRMAYRLYRPLERWLLSRADAVIATSQAYAKASEPLRPWSQKVAVVPLGISDPMAQIDPSEVARVRGRVGGPFVFSIGRMAWYKGFDVLVRAAAQLPSDVRVVIGGSGGMLPSLREQVRSLGLQDRVFLLGEMTRQDVVHFHAAAEGLCLPSTARAEAFGLSLLESMAHGKPSVVSGIDGSGVGWVHQDGVTGSTVPPLGVEPLALALCRMMKDPHWRASCGAAARSRYLEAFTAQHMAEGVESVYRRALAASRC